MPVNLNLRTEDPSAEHQFIEWQFVKTDNGQVELRFGNRRATLASHKWATLVEAVKQLSPSRWRSNRPIPELAGDEPARDILRGCEDTPRFQLLLAGVDIVHAFRIMENTP
jgi:hypothetical protein